jgi:hypothetical protein
VVIDRAGELRADAEHLAQVRRLGAHGVHDLLVRGVDDRDRRARVEHEILDVVGRGQLGHRHRDRAGVDHAEDRGGGLERVAHQDQDALAARQLEPAQRGREPAHAIGELVVGPRAIALAQRAARTGAVSQRGLEEPRRQVAGR